jgi:dihydroxyacetone kinase DhaKLM complex PTS-EIIA-like component DhaM
MRTQSPLIVLQINVILNTENDEVYFFKELGSRRLKGSTIIDIQDNIKNRAERYKKQLTKY